MLIHRLVVSPWQANCYILQPSEQSPEVVVVDPGIFGAAEIAARLDELSLVPVALLGSHGHIDHVGDAHVLAERFEIPLHLTEPDQPLLTKPGLALSAASAQFLPQMLGGTDELPPVRDVVTLRREQEVGPLRVAMTEAPGHTKGSCLLEVSHGGQSVILSGDVLFAGSIGRTDFPGGSMSEMRDSLRRIVADVDRVSTMLPGHGPATTLGDELATNPYLQADFLKVD